MGYLYISDQRLACRDGCGIIQAMAKRHNNRPGDLQSLFFHLEELVLANSGEDEFEEIFKLLIAKLWDERCGKPHRFESRESPGATYELVVKLLREAEVKWPGLIEPGDIPALTPDHLHVCVDALQRHTISDNTLEVMDGFFEFLVSRNAKGAKGQYFTPRHVIEMCVQLLQPQSGELILDPACGSGGFLIHALMQLRETGSVKLEDIADYCAQYLWGFDLDGRALRVAKALMIVAGDGQANLVRLNSLIRPDMAQNMTGLFPRDNGEVDLGSGLTVEDVCRSRIRGYRGFDLILTNPPFAGEVRERAVLDGYDLGMGRNRLERDVLFLERCVELLRPGGRMAVVLPHNKFAASAFVHAREWLFKQVHVIGVVGLGRNTFLPHTHQKASVLLARKRNKGERCSLQEPTFFALSEKEGKDSKGRYDIRKAAREGAALWERVDHDLGDIIEKFRAFSKEHEIFREG